jgi:hypothetical protein
LPVKMFSICTPRFWKLFPTRWKNSRTLRNGSPRVPLPSASANAAPTRAVPEHGDGAELEGEPGNGDGVSTKSTKRHERNALRNFSTHPAGERSNCRNHLAFRAFRVFCGPQFRILPRNGDGMNRRLRRFHGFKNW